MKNFPFEALAEVIDYSWSDEEEDYNIQAEENGECTGHIFEHLKELDAWYQANKPEPKEEGDVMSIKYKDPEPRDRVEILTCDICSGRILEDHFGHPDDDDVDFHAQCWANAPEWTAYCPPTLFNAEVNYGEYVEAARTGKCILFIDGEDRYPAI